MSFGLPAFFSLVFLFGALRWRHAVMGAMVLVVFEGALRKWVFQEEQQMVYMVKDILLLGAYAGFFVPRLQRRKRLIEHHPANVPLILLAAVAVLQLANPALQNLWVGLFGLKAYLLYVPLLYLVPAAFPNVWRFRRFCLGYLAMALLPMALGVVQFGSPPDSALNRYAWTDELAPGVALFGSDGGQARITGTFSYISGYTAYLTLIVLFALALLVFEREKRLRLGLYGLLALVLANLLMTGSRGPFLVLGAAALALFLLAAQAGVRGAARAALFLCVSLPLVAFLAWSAFPEAYREFFERVRQNDDVAERIWGVVENPVWAFDEAGLLGYGIGSTHQAAAFLNSTDSGGAPPPAEGEWERIILEIGALGFALVLLARLLVSYRLWVALCAAAGTELKPFLVAAFLFSLISLPGNLIFNHTAHLFYWFLAGFALIPAAQDLMTDQEQRIPTRERQRTALVS